MKKIMLGAAISTIVGGALLAISALREEDVLFVDECNKEHCCCVGDPTVSDDTDDCCKPI